MLPPAPQAPPAQCRVSSASPCTTWKCSPGLRLLQSLQGRASAGAGARPEGPWGCGRAAPAMERRSQGLEPTLRVEYEPWGLFTLGASTQPCGTSAIPTPPHFCQRLSLDTGPSSHSSWERSSGTGGPRFSLGSTHLLGWNWEHLNSREQPGGRQEAAKGQGTLDHPRLCLLCPQAQHCFHLGPHEAHLIQMSHTRGSGWEPGGASAAGSVAGGCWLGRTGTC